MPVRGHGSGSLRHAHRCRTTWSSPSRRCRLRSRHVRPTSRRRSPSWSSAIPTGPRARIASTWFLVHAPAHALLTATASHFARQQWHQLSLLLLDFVKDPRTSVGDNLLQVRSRGRLLDLSSPCRPPPHPDFSLSLSLPFTVCVLSSRPLRVLLPSAHLLLHSSSTRILSRTLKNTSRRSTRC